MANGSRIHRIVMVIRSVFINSYPAMTKDYNMTPGFLIPYDVHPSDGRFLFMKTINKPAKLVVITNWFDELDRLLPH
jgi:hypothetical protein